MASDDFELSDDNDEEDENDDNQNDKGTKQSLAMRDTSKLTLKEQRKLLKKQHPELLPLVSYFGDIVKELQSSTSVATRALMDSDDTAKVCTQVYLFVGWYFSMRVSYPHPTHSW